MSEESKNAESGILEETESESEVQLDQSDRTDRRIRECRQRKRARSAQRSCSAGDGDGDQKRRLCQSCQTAVTAGPSRQSSGSSPQRRRGPAPSPARRRSAPARTGCCR